MNKTILVVDDSASVRQVVREALTEAGYSVMEAEDGKDALSQMDGKRIHLIISDVHMPVMDGIEFLRHVKAHPAYKFTPVIMLTVDGAEENKLEGMKAGARAWVTKPFSISRLLDAVSKMIIPPPRSPRH